jgi:hypothetical protein
MTKQKKDKIIGLLALAGVIAFGTYMLVAVLRAVG